MTNVWLVSAILAFNGRSTGTGRIGIGFTLEEEGVGGDTTTSNGFKQEPITLPRSCFCVSRKLRDCVNRTKYETFSNHNKQSHIRDLFTNYKMFTA